MRALLLIACFVFASANTKEIHSKLSHEQKAGKVQRLGHWDEHWAATGKPPTKHDHKDVLKHAPEVVPHHEAHMQADLGYKKHGQEKHKGESDLHLQDLLMEESVRHDNRQQRTQKPRPTHVTHHQEAHQIPKPKPTITDVHRPENSHGDVHNAHVKAASNHKATKKNRNGKGKKNEKKEKKNEKKSPKKYNPRKHDKKNYNKQH